MFSSQLPLAALVDFCRVLRHSLAAGIGLRDVFRQQAARGPAAVRPVAERIHNRLDHGESLEAALVHERAVFPPLFLAMAVVGEQSGNLPEVFAELEKYYLLQQKLQRQFRSRTFFSLLQLCIAFVVIAAMLFVLGLIAEGRGGQGPAVLGVRGPGAAIVFLVLTFGTLALLVVGFRLLRRSLSRTGAVDGFLLRLPALGPCLRALALGRFALSLRLTLDSRITVTDALRLSLAATGNTAFQARTDIVVDALQKGDDLTLALSGAQIFPADFLAMVAVGEEGGRVPEIMRHQADQYNEEAARRLTGLTRGLTFAVWLGYAAFMVIAIFQLALRYLRLGG
jgi:type IV pilus assembly protein PilC